ncbi:MAG: hypothetical protein JWR19_1853 [Pedosphaera sp.]|nr:hypothetical protein [Pedosphaera sp.]
MFSVKGDASAAAKASDFAKATADKMAHGYFRTVISKPARWRCGFKAYIYGQGFCGLGREGRAL